MNKRSADLSRNNVKKKRKNVVAFCIYDEFADFWSLVVRLLQPSYSDVRSLANVCKKISQIVFFNLTELYVPEIIPSRETDFLNRDSFLPERLVWLRFLGGYVCFAHLRNLIVRSTGLTRLDVPSLGFLENFYGLNAVTTLRSLTIRDQSDFMDRTAPPMEFADFGAMLGCTESLTLDHTDEFTSQMLGFFTNLSSLTIRGCEDLDKIDRSITSRMTNLTFLSVEDGFERIGYESIASLTSLRELRLMEESLRKVGKTDVRYLSSLVNLERLETRWYRTVVDSKILGSLPSLKTLRIHEMGRSAERLPGGCLNHLSNVTTLELVRPLASIEAGLSNLVNLTDLRVIDDDSVTEKSLSNLSSLTRLEVKNCNCRVRRKDSCVRIDLFDGPFWICEECESKGRHFLRFDSP